MRMNKSFLGAVAAMVFCGGIAHAQAKEGWPADIKIGTASQGHHQFVDPFNTTVAWEDQLLIKSKKVFTGDLL